MPAGPDVRSIAPPPPSPARRGAVVALLLVGLGLCVALPQFPRPDETHPVPQSSAWRWVVLAGVVGLGMVPAVNRRLVGPLERLRRLTPRGRAGVAVAVAVGAGVYLAVTAAAQNRDLFPKTYDEASYMIQARQFASGRLAYPRHELADFFDAPNLLARPVYASAYFPGAALFFVPGVWLGLPAYLTPLLIAAAGAGLMFRVVAELVDALAGVLGVLLLLGSNVYRMMSVMPMSQPPMLLLGLVIVWAYLRYRAAPRWPWAAALGALAGWAAVTRPVDALCFVVPVALDLAVMHWRSRGGGAARSLVAFVLAAAPFVGLQLALNYRVTGSVARSPFSLYIDADQPQTSFGFHRLDPAARPRSVVAQKQALYAEWVLPYVRNHQPDTVVRAWLTRYFPLLADGLLPARVVLVLLPVGLLGLIGRPRWVVALTLAGFLGLYFFYAFFIEHYALTVAPAMALLIALAMPVLERAWPRFRAGIVVAITLGVVAVCVTSLREFTGIGDESLPSPALRALNDYLPELVHGERSVVLFRFAPGVNNPQEEPVFNAGVAWPDDAAVVRAHDLGARNAELFAYYARHDPERVAYLYDRTPTREDPLGTLTRLGRVSDLLKQGSR